MFLHRQATHAFLSCSIAFDAFVEMHVNDVNDVYDDGDVVTCLQMPTSGLRFVRNMVLWRS